MIRTFISFLLLVTISSNSFASSIKSYPNGFADVVEGLLPAVVNVYTSKNPKQQNLPSTRRVFPKGIPGFEDLFERFEAPFGLEDMYLTPKATSLGSGFIIDETGYIVTNHHVIESADEIFIKLGTNEELPAKLIGSDQRTDLALLKVDSKTPLPFVKFGDSTKSRVGDWVIAIGNPFGLGGTVTTGIISSKGRDISDGFVDDFIQTDTAINSGNSGGPMFNMDGQVIGVNTSIYSPSGTNIGIGFAIPSSTASSIIDQLKKNGKVTRGMLGIKIQDVTPEIAEGLDLSTNSGVLVVEVDSGSAADKAGIKPNDIITEFNGVATKNSRKLQIAVSEASVGMNANIVVLRNKDKKNLSCHITEYENKNNVVKHDRQAVVPNGSIEKNGIIFSNLTNDLANRFNIKDSSKGVIITGFANQKNHFYNLLVGDIVLQVNKLPVNSLDDLKKIYDDAIKTNKKHIVFFVIRNNAQIVIALPIDLK